MAGLLSCTKICNPLQTDGPDRFGGEVLERRSAKRLQITTKLWRGWLGGGGGGRVKRCGDHIVTKTDFKIHFLCTPSTSHLMPVAL